mmetsp:Transcript_15126/g.37835  ORF Transcript_15126/g.37835 Transcript_15126/m.37835 type:complete len:217 (-) Transcript_15126:2118-2768(-)
MPVSSSFSHNMSISLSANRMTIFRPFRIVARARIGSITASNVSRTLSSSIGKPSSIARCTLCRYAELLCCTEMSPLADSRLLIHDKACSCGSMINGQRVHLVMMAAFSIESRSDGSPSPFQLARCASSQSSESGSRSSEQGISRPRKSGTHVLSQSCSRNSESNGPMYAINGAATITFPTSIVLSCSSRSTLMPQRSFSSLRPLTNLSARFRRFAV